MFARVNSGMLKSCNLSTARTILRVSHVRFFMLFYVLLCMLFHVLFYVLTCILFCKLLCAHVCAILLVGMLATSGYCQAMW